MRVERLNHTDGPSPAFCWALNKAFGAYLSSKGGLTVVGRENIPLKGSYIAAPSHTSQLDTAVIGRSILDTTGRNLHFMSKPEYWQGRYRLPTGLFISLGGGFEIERGSSFDKQPEVRARLDSIFANQEGLVIYPEGRRMDKNAPITRLKAGIGLLAVKYGAPVIPIGIAGTLERDYMTIVFGEAMYAEHVDFDLGNPKEIRQVSGLAGEFRRDLAESMQELKVQAWAIRQVNIHNPSEHIGMRT